jgi:ComEC/Rec2-related protein
MTQSRWLKVQARILIRSWRRYLVPSRVLIVTSILALMGAVTASFSLPLIWLGLICMAGLALGVTASSRTLICLWLVLPLLFYTNVVLRIPVNNDYSLDGAFVSFEGKVIESQGGMAPSLAPKRILVQMQPTCCMVEARKISLPSVLPGDIIMVQGRLELPRHAFYPWQFDYAQFLRYKGAAYICRPAFVQIVRRGYCYPLLKAFEDARTKLVTVQEKLMGTQPAQLLISIVLGDRAVSVGTETEDVFRAVGLSHVLAASGFNLSIVVMAARWTMGYAIRRILWLNLLTIPWIASYDLMAGLSPSILRATLMILLALGLSGLLRRAHGIAVLAACIMSCLILYPGCLQDVGFQLSYLATFGIVSGAKELQQVICGSIKRVALSKWLGEVISVVLLAQAFVLPVQLSYFWKFSLLFLPANLIVDPLLPPLTILGFVSCIAALFTSTASASNGLWYLCSYLDRACSQMLQLLLFAVKNLAEHNQATNLCVGPPPVIIAAAFLVCLSFFAWGLKVRKYVFLLGMLLIVATACLLFVRPVRPKLIVANFGASVVLLNSTGRCMILGNKSCRDADAFARFAGGLQCNDLLPFKIDHHEKFDVLCCGGTQNVLLFDLAALDQARSDLSFADTVIPKCALAVAYNSSASAVAHSSRVATAICLSHLLAHCHIRQLLLDAPDSKWLMRSKHFYKDLPNIQIDLPRGGCSIVALMGNGSFAQWTAKSY